MGWVAGAIQPIAEKDERREIQAGSWQKLGARVLGGPEASQRGLCQASFNAHLEGLAWAGLDLKRQRSVWREHRRKMAIPCQRIQGPGDASHGSNTPCGHLCPGASDTAPGHGPAGTRGRLGPWGSRSLFTGSLRLLQEGRLVRAAQKSTECSCLV